MWRSQDWVELWFCLMPGLLWVGQSDPKGNLSGCPTHHLLTKVWVGWVLATWDNLCRHICRPITPAPLWTSPSRKRDAGQTLVADYLVNTWIPKFSCRSHSQNSSNLTDPRGRDFCVFATGVAAGSFTYIAYGVAFQTSRIALCSGGVGATIWSPLLRIKSCSALKYNLEHVYIYVHICSSYIQWISVCYSNFFTSKKYY